MEMKLEIITSSHSAGTGEHGPAQKLLRGTRLIKAVLGPCDSAGPVQTSFRNVPDVDNTCGEDRKSDTGRVESGAVKLLLAVGTWRSPCWVGPVVSVTDLSSHVVNGATCSES